MTQCWAWREVQGARVRDKRRVRSLMVICARLEENAGLSLSAACGPATRQAAHRIFSHPRINPMDLLHGHVQETVRRCAGHPLVLVAQDSTEFSYSTHPATTGLGPVRVPGDQGFHGHAALALTPSGEPLGLLHAHFWSRDFDEIGKKHRRKKRPTAEKESRKWINGLAAIEAALPPTQQVLVIQDREGDFFAFMAAPRRPNTHLLIRAYEPRHARVATQPDGPSTSLLSLAADAEVVGEMDVTVPRQTGKPERIAHLTLRAAQVQLVRPRAIRQVEGLPRHALLWVIRAAELTPPDGETAIDWILLTSWPVVDGESACQMVRYYARRWALERLHWVLKSGLRVERLQLDDAASLQNAMAIYYIVAWRLLFLTHAARTQPDAPAELFLPSEERIVLQQARGTPVDTVREAVRAIAQLGGWESYPSAGEPGPKSLWQGLRKLMAMAEGWRLALNAIRSGHVEI